MTDNSKEIYTWYEKTVEYKFVLEAKGLWGIDFLSPLAGSAERIGDAVIEKGAKSYIIEFKKELGGMASEYDKYVAGSFGYLKTCRLLEKQELHACKAHYMVGGFLFDNDNLGLRIRDYFSPKQIPDTLIGKENEGEVEGIADFFSPDSGFDFENLNEYIRIMTLRRDNKINDKSDEGESGGGITNQRIIAVSTDKKAVSMSLSYYRRYLPELKKKYELTKELVKKRKLRI